VPSFHHPLDPISAKSPDLLPILRLFLLVLGLFLLVLGLFLLVLGLFLLVLGLFLLVLGRLLLVETRSNGQAIQERRNSIYPRIFQQALST
jgi:membrane-bound ClpP family serine protease